MSARFPLGIIPGARHLPTFYMNFCHNRTWEETPSSLGLGIGLPPLMEPHSRVIHHDIVPWRDGLAWFSTCVSFTGVFALPLYHGQGIEYHDQDTFPDDKPLSRYYECVVPDVLVDAVDRLGAGKWFHCAGVVVSVTVVLGRQLT